MTASPDLTALHAVRIDVPVTSTLLAWAVLLLVAVLALAGLGLLARRPDKGDPASTRPPWWRMIARRRYARLRRPNTAWHARLVAEARELAREAADTASRAHRAAAAAGVAQQRHDTARLVREETATAHDQAQHAHDEAFTALRRDDAARVARQRDEDDDEQDREVSRAALAAFRRGDLTVDQLREVFRRTGGWDPVHEQREREIAVLRAEAHRAHRAYDAASAAEKMAAKAASVAAIGANAAGEEAARTVAEAAAARVAATRYGQALRRGTRWQRFW